MRYFVFLLGLMLLIFFWYLLLILEIIVLVLDFLKEDSVLILFLVLREVDLFNLWFGWLDLLWIFLVIEFRGRFVLWIGLFLGGFWLVFEFVGWVIIVGGVFWLFLFWLEFFILFLEDVLFLLFCFWLFD